MGNTWIDYYYGNKTSGLTNMTTSAGGALEFGLYVIGSPGGTDLD